MKKAWVIHGGRDGEFEDLFLSKGIAGPPYDSVFGPAFDVLKEDLSSWPADWKSFRNRFRLRAPELTGSHATYGAGQLAQLVQDVHEGDIVVLPRKGTATLTFGTIAGSYRFDPAIVGVEHHRPVVWLKSEVAKTLLRSDLNNSLSSRLLTLFRIRVLDAVRRLEYILESGEPDPGPSSTEETPIASFGGTPAIEEAPLAFASHELPDFSTQSDNAIVEFLSTKFHGHRLSSLIAGLLAADGYTVFQSKEGSDGGVDLLAGSGPLGFDSPRLCVQVKSGTTPMGTPPIRDLVGTMQRVNASHGLFVSWAGFTREVESNHEMSQTFFRVRLWDSEDVLRKLYEVYDRLPSELQAELPLKRIWVLQQEVMD